MINDFFNNILDYFNKKLSKLEKFLVCIIGVLIIIILAGTLIGIIKRGTNPGKFVHTLEPTESEIKSLNKKSDTNVEAYSSIGTLRIVTASEKDDEPGIILVVAPWFTYPSDDVPFFEELSRKNRLIESIFTSYFSQRTGKELMKEKEENIIRDLMEQINNELTLGKIQDIYFTQYVFLE